MADWQTYSDLYPSGERTVTGHLKVMRGVHSPQLNNWRDVYVLLPPSYAETERRYPVIYMHDGQNLFDVVASYAGEWDVDEAMQRLSAEGIEAIIVGIAHMGDRRIYEYSPFPSPYLSSDPQGDLYLSFIRHTLKPLIDRDFRTKPNSVHTGLFGASLGGLISLYGYFRKNKVFGFAGVMSPAFWFVEAAIFDFVERSSPVSGKIYLDTGTAEMERVPLEHRRPGVTSTRYVQDARRMNNILLQKGYRPGRTLRYVEAQGAIHHEDAWAQRFPDALRFLLGG